MLTVPFLWLVWLSLPRMPNVESVDSWQYFYKKYFYKRWQCWQLTVFLSTHKHIFSKSWECWQLTVFFNTFITTTTRALLYLNPLKTRRYKSRRNHKHLRFVFRGKLSKNFQKTFRKLSENFPTTFEKLLKNETSRFLAGFLSLFKWSVSNCFIKFRRRANILYISLLLLPKSVYCW